MTRKFNREIIKHIIVIIVVGLFVLYCVYCFLVSFLIIKVKEFSVIDNNISISWYNFDKENYYLFLPKGMNRDKLLLNIKSNFKEVKIDCYDKNNNKIGSLKDNGYTDIFMNDEIKLKIKMKNKFTRTYKVKIMQSNINSLIIETRHGDNSFNNIITDKKHITYDHAKAVLYDLDGNQSNYNIKKIRGRGNSTWLRPKKPFQLKLYDKESILGMNEANKWILLANHWDGSLSRNYIWYTLARQLQMDYSVDCRPVDLFINQNYLGSYLLTNKINVPSYDEENTYLFEITNTMNYDIELTKGYRLNIKNINFNRISDEEVENIKIKVTKYLNKIEKNIYDEDVTLEELSEYLDIDSFIKYYWIQEISENYDVSRGSNYLYLKDNKIYMGPVWDMDNTLNRSYLYADLNEKYILDNKMLDSRISENWYKELFKKEEFSKLVDNYFVDNIDTFDRLIDELDNYKELINNSAKMNYVRWPYQDMQKEQIRQWVEGDMDYLSSIKLLKNNLKDRINYYKDIYELK